MMTGNVELYNIAELLEGDGTCVLPPSARADIAAGNPDRPLGDWADIKENGRWFCRIPDGVRYELNGSAQLAAIQAAGAEIRFRLPPGGKARIVLNSPFKPVVAEVWAGSFFRDWSVVGTENTEITIEPPPNPEELQTASKALNTAWDPTLIRVFVPWRPQCRLVSIEGEMLPPLTSQVPDLRYLAYGSSITHGNTAVRPTGCYASRTAERLEANLINLGFGGGAHLEESIARYIAGRADWDIATFELGINLLARVDVEEFERRVDRFIDVIVEAHPEKPLFFIDVFRCRYDFGTPDMQEKVGAFRKIVRSKVERMSNKNLMHIDGRDLLSGPDCLTADLVHPSPAGMETIAARLAAIVGSTLAARTQYSFRSST